MFFIEWKHNGSSKSARSRSHPCPELTGAPESAFHNFRIDEETPTLPNSAHSTEDLSNVANKLEQLAQRIREGGIHLDEATLGSLVEIVNRANQELEDAGVTGKEHGGYMGATQLEHETTSRYPGRDFVDAQVQTLDEVAVAATPPQRQRKRPAISFASKPTRSKRARIAQDNTSPISIADTRNQNVAPMGSRTPLPSDSRSQETSVSGAYMLLPVTNTMSPQNQTYYNPYMPYYYTQESFAYPILPYYAAAGWNSLYQAT